MQHKHNIYITLPIVCVYLTKLIHNLLVDNGFSCYIFNVHKNKFGNFLENWFNCSSTNNISLVKCLPLLPQFDIISKKFYFYWAKRKKFKRNKLFVKLKWTSKGWKCVFWKWIKLMRIENFLHDIYLRLNICWKLFFCNCVIRLLGSVN